MPRKSNSDPNAYILPSNSKAMKPVRNLISKVATTNLPVLIKGETGVGRSLVARTIHELSNRSSKPFFVVKLGDIVPSFAHSELFGHVKGAFTGAISNKKGLFSFADGGTLVIEELEYADIDIQIKILRFLENYSFRMFGSGLESKIDVRIVSISTQEPEISSNFMPELLNRLSEVVIEIPPLRQRKEDIERLTAHFLKNQTPIKSIASDAINALKRYDFPGNVRELERIIKRAVIFAENLTISKEDLLLPKAGPPSIQPSSARIQEDLIATKRELDILKQSAIPAIPIWEGRWFKIEEDYCFVLMPFSEFDDIQIVYTNHVKKVLETKCNIRCERADDIYDISGVMQSVWEGINRARIIIADLTGRNPNVFYELGIAHTLGKPVIMITQSMDYVPFDLRHLRCIVYTYKPKHIDKFEERLSSTVRSVLSSTTPPSLKLYPK